jgi:hypothetical protein
MNAQCPASIRGRALRWVNNGTPKHAILGPQGRR